MDGSLSFLFVPTVVPAVVFLMHHHAGRGGEKEARAEHSKKRRLKYFMDKRGYGVGS